MTPERFSITPGSSLNGNRSAFLPKLCHQGVFLFFFAVLRVLRGYSLHPHKPLFKNRVRDGVARNFTCRNFTSSVTLTYLLNQINRWGHIPRIRHSKKAKNPKSRHLKFEIAVFQTNPNDQKINDRNKKQKPARISPEWT